MPIDFFEQEVRKCQDRFNETFGQMIVCNIQTRTRVILAIVSMGRLAQKVQAAKNKDQVRDEIKRFVRSRDVLTNLFNDAEQELKQQQRRKQWSDSTDSTERRATGSSSITA